MSTKIDYEQSINQAIDFIRKNISQKILLNDIANAADISPYHFHRIFRSIKGETPNTFVKRLRLEKSASLLISHPEMSITDISFECGFSSSQVFSRDFKDYFEQTPSQFKKENTRWSKISNIGSNNDQKDSKKREASIYTIEYTNINGRPGIIYKTNYMNGKIEVIKLPDMCVAYIRHTGPYKGDAELFGRLFEEISKWASSHGHLNKETQMYSVYYEDSDITDESKAMVDVCVSIPKKAEVRGDVGKQVLPGGEYAIGKFTITGPEDYQKAWDSIYSDWLPQSGYLPDDRPAFELYRSDSMNKDSGEYEHKVEICVPVKPA